MHSWLFEAQPPGLEGEQVLALRIECLPVGLCTRQTGCLGRTLYLAGAINESFILRNGLILVGLQSHVLSLN